MTSMHLYTFIGINNHPKECFSLCAQQIRETEKQMKDNINKATKTFQRKISFEGVKEYVS